MRGHEELIRLRRKGLKPSGLVYVDDYPVLDKWVAWLTGKTMTTICTHGDDPRTLDFRCLVGLVVNVTGNDPSRVKAIAGMCRKAGASVVFAMAGEKAAVWKQGESKWRNI